MINKPFKKPVVFLLITFAFLLVISIAIPETNLGWFKIRKMHLFSSLTKQNNRKLNWDSLIGLPTKSTNSNEQRLTNKKSRLTPLTSFFVKLKQSKSQEIRIAYFGDSMIEGDLITQELRKRFQTRFGGNGVGFVGAACVTAKFRATILHSFSPTWGSYSLMTPNPSHNPLGLSGFVYVPETRRYLVPNPNYIATIDSMRDSLTPAVPESVYVTKSGNYWIDFKAVSQFNPTADFRRIRLLYSNAPNGSYIEVKLQNQPTKRIPLSSGSNLQQMTVSSGLPIKNLHIQFFPTGKMYVYGFIFDSPTGVYIDNYSLRGYGGNRFTSLSLPLMQEYAQILPYDLIVLQYGANVSNPETKSYTYYKKTFINSINYIKRAYPNTPILVVGMGDKAVKIDGEYKTSPDIPLLIKSQYEASKETNSAFWNLFDAMGGTNSMIEYVNAKPPLARKDYLHFNRGGTTKVADLLYNALIGEYEKN